MKEGHYSSQQVKEKYDKIFIEAYRSLNDKQKVAVNSIEGPVMVNAGPGTGKTQILALRIGKILLDQDIAPHNILCLTFTDSATIEMRNRLVQIIGPIAHKVHIHTYHSFCNQVIQENLDIFGGYRKLEAISDLESVDVYRAIIDAIPDNNILKRYKTDKYFEHKRLKNLFELMKKENLSCIEMVQKIDSYLESMRSSEEFFAKRKTTAGGVTYMKGDFREDHYGKLVDKFNELRSAVELFPGLEQIMDKNERYDFNDMILWVLREFDKNADLLSQYQERYLYFLVDEFQDTNGSQNALLSQLISYWDKPNVFVVGDDDQAIYKFQGANLNNIIDFKNKYHPLTIVLEDNYRSNQLILDVAGELIFNNSERLVRQDPDLTKDIKASGTNKTDKTLPIIYAFEKQSEEYALIAHELEELYNANPETFNDTGVIYRNHKQVEDLVNVLEKRNIPLNIKRRINILELPIIKNLLNILWYLSDEYKKLGRGQHRLFEILHYNYWEIDSIDIGRIALKCQKRDEEDNYVEWRKVISDTKALEDIKLKTQDAVLSTSRRLEKWIKEIPEVTIQTLFENLLNEGEVLRYIMAQSNKSWLLQVVSTFFDFIKKETAKNPQLKLEELLLMIKKMEENQIDLSINKLISSAKGVNFITAHSAKGREFKKVYIIGCTKNIWDENKRVYNQYKYPDNINADSKNNVEDERRLFYVAMTRAKTDLVISYSRFTEDGKNLGNSMFIDELTGGSDLTPTSPEVSEEILANFYYNLLKKEERIIPLIEDDLIDNWFQSYQMSVTHLNKFLRCPLSFYFESVLRIPHARNAASGFGTAIHDALRSFFVNYNERGTKDIADLLFFFSESLKKYKSHFTDDEFESYLNHGERTLKALLENKKDSWFNAPKIALEEKLANAEYKGVAIKGFLDKVEIYKDYVHVVDYKSGNAKNASSKLKPPSDRDPNGGDYWRQLVFYKMLLDSDKKHDWNMVRGEIEFVEPDRKTGEFSTHECVVSQEDMLVVGDQILDSYNKIKNHEFDKTCDQDDCYWCNFVKENYKLNSELLEIEHEYGE